MLVAAEVIPGEALVVVLVETVVVAPRSLIAAFQSLSTAHGIAEMCTCGAEICGKKRAKRAEAARSISADLLRCAHDGGPAT